MSTPLQLAAEELWQHGMTQININQKLVDRVRVTHKAFITKRHALQDYDAWAMIRPGEEEADRGLVVRRPEEKKDVKSFFHFDEDTPIPQGFENEPEAVMFYRAQRALYEHVNVQVTQLLYFLRSRLVPPHAWYDIFSDLQWGPYNWTTLRTLHYPPGLMRAGARLHIDRSFITVHMGDEGGELRALEGNDDTSGGVNVSPPTGKALVFFGVKSLWLTGAIKEPLWHSSVTSPGEERFALVQFCHLPLMDGYLVKDARKALCHYDEVYR